MPASFVAANLGRIVTDAAAANNFELMKSLSAQILRVLGKSLRTHGGFCLSQDKEKLGCHFLIPKHFPTF